MKTGPILTVLLCGLMIFALAGPVRAQGDEALPAAITGFWYTQDHDGGIELYACGDKICGRFYWLKDNQPGQISRDEKNPDPALRHRPLCRMQFMGGFAPDPDEENHYVDGWIYSPRHGQNFDAEMTLKDPNTLELHGYVVVPLFGQSQIWTRAATLPKCMKK